ncbi:uncharacterized protein JN550_008612 [Neoarthrinium moseri]|uniref:uncharacterized protein n=1 Tax=Neoarthrinium moseri TaxID=1658444 RepID=UPI001FDDB73E|nr:uncharacterized protein JN550_008612 [Neoarthrinium moseri]KAI1865066.1 hypothetical protein JN550_008612 [Neoarthrinium moseri]
MAPSTRTWLITGCSSGFGELFVKQLRASGDNVIATGRNAETRLGHLKGHGASIMDLDVSAPSDVIDTKMTEAWGLHPGGIDVVVNNAGYILSGAIEELTQQDMEDIFRTNFHGPLNITRALLPRIRAKGKGAVECLAQELAIFAPGVKVLIIEPGYFRTRAFGNINHVPPRVECYSEFNAAVRKVEAGIVGNEPGNADKAVEIMIDLVRGTGVAAGKQVPLRIPLGSDGWARVKAKCENTIKICDEWENVAKSTDIEQAEHFS